MNNRRVDDEIRTHPCPDCYLCGTQGNLLYQFLKDRLFGVPGKWNLKRCSSPGCGLVWLDPMPIEEDLGKAYQTYFTHQETPLSRRKKSFGKLFRNILRMTHNSLLVVTLIYRERNRVNLMYLDKTRPGKLLEVGCGNGRRLREIQLLGWEVEGLEVDPKAVDLARINYGLPVHLGLLEDIAFPEGTFDTIIMKHVIEHVYNPVGLLAECRRILKLGGTLVSITPNVESYGHKFFQSYWRGLEPPRHLHLFSKKTLCTIAAKAGFLKYHAWTTSARAERIGLASMRIKNGYRHELGKPYKLSRRVWGLGYQFWVSCVHLKDKNSGEECVLKIIK